MIYYAIVSSDLENAFNNLWGSNFLEYVCETQIDCCGLNGKLTKEFSIVSLMPDWHKLIEKSFDIRHKVVHDANYRVEIEIHFIQKVEVIFLFIPQLVTYFLAQRFDLKHTVFSNGEFAVPYLFSVQEILSDDWVVVNN
ncbi:hypothetical protein [Leptospira santarosai]|uniref:hypothetical protein n=1 Tax=Leptospira santarosai TaxID=28183 RepID=UPI0012BA7D26|nr:hypothetical protein [Leptospira santarosai]